MRFIFKVLIGLFLFLSLAALGLYVTGNEHIFYGLGPTYFEGKSKPDIYDMKHFSLREISADHPEPWPMSAAFNKANIPSGYMSLLDSMETTAFLVFRNDSLLFEKYWLGAEESTLTNSFSMAKSFTAMLIGKAIQEGYIKSLDQSVGEFIPEFSEGKNATLTIRHLLQMASGIPYGESYSSPFGYMAKSYFGRDLIAETMKYKVVKEPGTFWAYEGGNSVLLGMIVQKATGRKVSEYFFQKIWSCIGAERMAYWNLDKEGGMEKTFSGFYSTARDFGRIGKLYMHQGIWENDTILSPDFVRECLKPNLVPDQHGETCSWYGLHWWLGKHQGEDFFSCRGLRGQYIVGIPSQNLIMVRLGHQQKAERVDHMPPDMHAYMALAKELAGQTTQIAR
jgi:CubicO group peptidase (beta-lactamase class C family)